MGFIAGLRAGYTSIALLLSLLLLPYAAHSKRVAVVGGSGRVGGSAVYYLHRWAAAARQSLEIHVVGRSEESYRSFRDRYGDRIGSDDSSITFDRLDVSVDTSVDAYLASGGFDLVVNTAGPFQGLGESPLLRSCLRCGVDYVDVCDDIALSRVCRSEPYQQLARASGATAIISAGIWPGVSSLLAKALVDTVPSGEVDEVLFSFFTAGSGGAGLTILTATFLLLGERVLQYRNGEAVYSDPGTQVLASDFGPGIGIKQVANLNLIECESCFTTNDGRVPAVSTFFGTDPPFWNLLFRVMCLVIPKRALQSRALMEKLAWLSLPAVRLVDSFVGSKNGIRVDVSYTGGGKARALLTHRDLEAAVGLALALFAEQLLHSTTVARGGVFFPEEVVGADFAQAIVAGVSTQDDNCIAFEIGRVG